MSEKIEKSKNFLKIISDIYVFILIIIFPLIVDKTGFFHILECKWQFFVNISFIYVLANVLVILYVLIIKRVNIFKHCNFSKVQWIAIVFLLLNIISCFSSPFFKKYDLFIGVGRGEGLIAMSLYILTFIFVSLFYKFDKKIFLYFSLSSILLNSVAILQYIGFNPFNMYQEGIGTHNVSFMTTIGNVDFISAMYCILLSISIYSFIFIDDNRKYENIIHLMSIFMGFFILSIIDVLSGKVAFIGTLIIVLPFIILNNKRLSKALIVFATILMTYCTNIIINPEYHYDLGKIGLYFQFNYIVLLFLIVCIVIIYLAYLLYKSGFDLSRNKKIIKYLYISFLIGGLFLILLVYFINFKSGILYEVHEILHGNLDDDFGTYRLFLWKRTLTLIPQYPILGSGPDTFAIRFMAKYSADVIKIGPYSINDTAANVYLTMIINLGIVGLITYLSFIISQIKMGMKKMNKYSVVLLIAIICYLIQDAFNLSVVIVSPVFWLLMGLHFASLSYKGE